jgi:hypothetical protein
MSIESGQRRSRNLDKRHTTHHPQSGSKRNSNWTSESHPENRWHRIGSQKQKIKEEIMNYLCVIGKYKRGCHGVFPDFAGEIIVGASTQKALEAKLANVLGAHLQAIKREPKPRFKTL